MVSGVTRACAAATPLASSAPIRSANSVALRSGGGLAVTTSSTSSGTVAAMARPKALPSAANTKPGREQVDDHAQLAEVARHQRIGRRDRREGNADIGRRQRQQRMLDAVAGEDHDRPLGREPAPQQRRADALHRVEHLRVGELAPGVVRPALGEEHAVRRLVAPTSPAARSAWRDSRRAAAALRIWRVPSALRSTTASGAPRRTGLSGAALVGLSARSGSAIEPVSRISFQP